MTIQNDDHEELAAWADGELEGEARQKMEQRMRSDPELARRARELAALDALLLELPEATGDSALVARTLTAAARESRTARFRSRAVRVAAVLVLVAGTAVGVRELVTPAPLSPLESDEPIE